jgi:diguanylate cyclase (GGDEF)-like protein
MDHSRVLVADRNASFLDKTAEILSTAKIQMIGSHNGAKVLTLCRHEQPDAVLLHTDLPGVSGTDLCLQIKTKLEPTLPVVLMFGEDTDRVADVARQCQADNFIIRPLKRTELLYCVRSVLQLRELLRGQAAGARLAGKAPGVRSGMVGLDTFHTFLELEVRRVDRYGFPLSLLSVSIDPLPEDVGQWGKVLDDQLGPALAEAIRSCVRDIDISAALTSRETLVVMPHTDREGGRLVGSRVCETVAAQSYHFGRSKIQPTASVGVACLHGQRAQPDELIARAQALRLRASEAGGNRVNVG